LPQASVAVQVRVMVFGQEPAEVIALNTGVKAPEQLSFAVTLAGAGTSPIHCTVTSVGQPLITGLVVSFTSIIWLKLALFPHESVAIQLRVMVVGQKVLEVTALNNAFFTVVSQLSVKVTIAGLGTSLKHCTLVLLGKPLNTGLVVSFTRIICELLMLFAQASVAVQVRVMVIGQKVAEVKALNIGVIDPSQLSVAVTFAGDGTATTHCTVVFAGNPPNTGLVVSFTVMVCEQLLLLPHASVAVQVRVIVFGQAPAEVIALKTGVKAPEQLSFAVTLAGAGTSPIHCTVTSVGHPLRFGLVVSFTVIVCVQELVFPQASVA